MTDIYKRLFSGYLLVLLDLSINNFDLLPDPIGYFLILMALLSLNKKEKSRKLMVGSVICLIMILITVSLYFTGKPRLNMSFSIFGYLSLITTMALSAGLGVIIYDVTIREYKHRQDQALTKKLVSECNWYAIINALSILSASTVFVLPINHITWVLIAAALASFAAQIHFIFTLNRVKKDWIYWENNRVSIDLEV